MSVLCVGQLVADVVVRPVDGLPRSGTASIVEDLQLVAGGCAANTACVLAKLGVKTALAAAVGRDEIGDAVLSMVAACGVDVGPVVRPAGVPTSAVIVLVAADGERSFLYRRGATERLCRDDVEDRLLDGVRFVHIGGAMKLPRLDLKKFLAVARSKGCATCLDTDWDPTGSWMATLEGALPLVDYLLTNEDEGRMLTRRDDPEEMGKSLLAAGPKVVVVKRGEKGALLVKDGLVRQVPAFRVKVLDTTCAGDAFAGGFLAALCEGLALEDSVRYGNAAGALCTTQVSHRGVVSAAHTKAFMDEDRSGGVR
jgi:sugar/nucleoside kinase (ribokinase family)